jgi:hypothetical protein
MIEHDLNRIFYITSWNSLTEEQLLAMGNDITDGTAYNISGAINNLFNLQENNTNADAAYILTGLLTQSYNVNNLIYASDVIKSSQTTDNSIIFNGNILATNSTASSIFANGTLNKMPIYTLLTVGSTRSYGGITVSLGA